METNNFTFLDSMLHCAGNDLKLKAFKYYQKYKNNQILYILSFQCYILTKKNANEIVDIFLTYFLNRF